MPNKFQIGAVLVMLHCQCLTQLVSGPYSHAKSQLLRYRNIDGSDPARVQVVHGTILIWHLLTVPLIVLTPQ